MSLLQELIKLKSETSSSLAEDCLDFDLQLNEEWVKVNPKSNERENTESAGKKVKTPKGEGVVTTERKIPTFGNSVPFIHMIWVTLENGKTEEFPAKSVKFITDAAPAKETEKAPPAKKEKVAKKEEPAE